MRSLVVICAFFGLVAASGTAFGPPPYSPGVQFAMDYFKSQSQAFAGSCTALRESIASRNVALARQRLADCRYHYKKIESFLEYFFRSSSTIYNKPPKYEAEEPDMEYQSPVGLQVIESLLYEHPGHPDQKALDEQARAVESAASDLPALLYDFKADDRQLLESLRIELVRIIALDITGYEAPLLRSGIQEAQAALLAFSDQLQPYLQKGQPRSDSLTQLIDRSMALLTTHPAGSPLPVSTTQPAGNSFDSFDRLTFLRQGLLPLQKQLGLFIREKDLLLNTNKVLNYEADNLFSPDALVPSHFPGDHPGNGPAMEALGKRLFSDPSLSGTGHKSCASCHNPAKMFTDGLPRSLALDGFHSLDRNAPTLLYSGFQYKQFWDGRAGSLEEQIRTVLRDPREMNADTTKDLAGIATSIAAYVRTLHPMNSAFDRYMRGDERALDTHEKKGANLFMGKAQCATCHFIPLFNGLIPPDYALTEFEVLGATRTDNLVKPALSPDPGRFKQYPFPFYKGAFKTPTVRNAALTGPYMHNGAFHNLQSLMDFYNKGGGAGLGLSVPDATLSPAPLHLSKVEMQDIILFMHALTDSLPDAQLTTDTRALPALIQKP